MKKAIKFALLPVLFAVFVLAVCALFADVHRAQAESFKGDYRYTFLGYDITYDISKDRKIAVTEDITVLFEGRDSTGFIRDIPVNAGEAVQNVKVKKDGEDAKFSVEKTSSDDGDFMSVDIGDASHKYGLTENYVLTYDYCLTKAQENGGQNAGTGDYLYLNAVPAAHSGDFLDVNVKIIAPAGFLGAHCYTGKVWENNECEFETLPAENGKTEILLGAASVPEYEGITFELQFEEGSLSVYFDPLPYWFALAAAALIFIMALVKVLFFNRHILTPVVNFEAPQGMDPLKMGKLIDNKVNSEDVTALIFYWADKGYVKINLDNRDDPSIIRIKNLPATADAHEQVVFAGLFRQGDSVKPSNLRYNFYGTFEKATALVNENTKGLYKSSSIGVSILFALLFGIILGLAPAVLGAVEISGTFIYVAGFIAIIPALILNSFTETVAYNRFKNRGKKNALYITLLALGDIALSALYSWLMPGAIMSFWAKATLSLLCFTGAAGSVVIISRTEKYNRDLSEIIGFRNFILHAQKDELEKLLEGDPQFYYHVLPYAQVLNVSSVWENKFKDLTVAPPVWATYSAIDAAIDFVIINSLINRSVSRIAADMISRPSSSGVSGAGGGFHGGFGGGHVGGGHGGGGVRGR